MQKFVVVLILFLGCSSPTAQVQISMEQIAIEPAFPGLRFDRPVDLQAANDGSNRIFIVEQKGVIKVLDTDDPSPVARVFLDIQDRVRDANNEEGLLGLAFPPNFVQEGKILVYYTASNPRRSVISSFRVIEDSPNTANPDMEFVHLTVGQPAGNHNGGQIAFGPDRYLYIALGDGGGANDQFQNGQDPTGLLGSILRIELFVATVGNVNYAIPHDNPFVGNTRGYREEIYAYGLRNPWRFSFDVETGLLFAADVGQNAYEEINVIENGGNYGWNTMEGFHCFNPREDCDPSGLKLPIAEYAHGGGPKSITGGYVYRGTKVPQLTGKYVYADYVDGRIWALSYDGTQVTENVEIANTDYNISSFGVDEQGELYFCAFNGQIYRFVSG